MAITEHAQASEAISTSEWSLTTDTAGPDSDTTDGIFQCILDLVNVANGDSFQFRVYETVANTGGTQRVLYETIFNHAQAEPLWISPALVLITGWDMTLKKLAGTDRTIIWSIRKVA